MVYVMNFYGNLPSFFNAILDMDFYGNLPSFCNVILGMDSFYISIIFLLSSFLPITGLFDYIEDRDKRLDLNKPRIKPLNLYYSKIPHGSRNME